MKWALISSDWCPPEKRNFRHTERHEGCTHRGKTTGGQSEKAADQKPTREASEETSPASTLISGFRPPDLGENTVLLLEPLSLRYFVTEAQQTDTVGQMAGCSGFWNNTDTMPSITVLLLMLSTPSHFLFNFLFQFYLVNIYGKAGFRCRI